MEHGSEGDTNCNRYSHQRTGKGTGNIGNKNASGDHLSDITVKISQNTEKNQGYLRKHGVTQTPVKDHQLVKVVK